MNGPWWHRPHPWVGCALCAAGIVALLWGAPRGSAVVAVALALIIGRPWVDAR